MRAAAAAAVSFLAIFSLAVASEVQWTKEYQMKFPSGAFISRGADLDNFLRFWKGLETSCGSKCDFKAGSASEEAYTLYTHYDTENHSFDLNNIVSKARSALGEADSSITVKFVGVDPDVTRAAPLSAASGLDAEEKFEEDISPCSNKYSRATKVKGLAFNKTFSSLGDISRYISGVLDMWSGASKGQALVIDKQYWTWSYTVTDNKWKDTSFDVTVSATYATLVEAKSGTAQPLEAAEVGIRLFADDLDHFGAKTSTRAWNLFTALNQYPHQCLCKTL